ncbi:hypothetical protein [Nodosilinea nodulosa]|uniref:hypothetical protein n=1 Tax=Nodosilinea nodulosa TaxID=416001 RepID=UPI0002D62D38|nr:hypothetical protein [Nodosilinea nodulosa]
MKRIILSILSAAAVVGAVAPMANAMPNRLDNLHQANLNGVYLNPRSADATHQTPGQTQSVQQASPSRLDQLRQAGLDGVYLNPRQVDVANQGSQDTHNVLVQTQQNQQPISKLMALHSTNVANR